MSQFFEAARALQSCIDENGWPFCFIGGLAVLRWGQARFTRDLDASLMCAFGHEDEVSEPLLAWGYSPRISDAREFARRNRVLLLSSPNGIPVDIALAALPYEGTMIRRSSLFEFEPDSRLRTCSAEDLMILKLFAFRPRDVVDAESIAIRQGRTLDWDYIETNLQPFAEIKDDPGIMTAFHRLRAATSE